MNAQELIDLAERCEKATGPDRAIDTAIVEALGWERRGGFLMGTYWVRGRDTIWFGHIPKVTASIDAAMALVPDGCVTMQDWLRYASEPPGSGPLLYEYFIQRANSDAATIGHAEAATRALALTAACLRAIASGMSAFGQDPKGLEAKPASPVAATQRDAQ